MAHQRAAAAAARPARDGRCGSLPSLLRPARAARARAPARAAASEASPSWRRSGQGVSAARAAAVQPDELRHPLDRENTRLLRSLPGLDAAARVLLPPGAEEVLALESIATSVLCSERQLPRVHAMACRAARVLGLERTPEVYVRQSPTPNAQACALGGRAPFIVLHTSLLELLDDDELTAVLAHECAHIRCEHGVYLSLASAMAAGAAAAPGLGALVSSPLEDELARWLRAAELTCDRAALLVVREPRVVVSALMKLAGGAPSLAGELSADAFLQQARRYDEATGDAGAMGWWLRSAHTRRLSHPLPVLRAREVDAFASSKQFAALSERVYGAAAGQQEARAADAGAASGPGASA